VADLRDPIQREDWETVRAALAGMHPADIAAAIAQAPESAHPRLFALLDDDVKPDVLAQLGSETTDDLLESLSDTELSNLAGEMSPDDAADVLAELPDKRADGVLNLMDREESDDVRMLLAYDEDSAGGIMTTDVVSMKAEQTVGEALDAVAHMDADEKFYFANVVDPAGRMLGYVDVWELLRERDRGRRLGDLIHRDFCAATVDMDQEQVANLMRKYDLDVIPVLDAGGVLVGRITGDDIMDVIEKEASEDILRLAGSDNADLESRSVLKSCLVRLPWLFITLMGGFLTSLILRRFHARIADMLVLAAFVPVVLAMGGNTGIQSSTLVVRRLALGDDLPRTLSALLSREILTGALMGALCGGVIGLWAHVVIAQAPQAVLLPPWRLALVVASALFAAMTFAAAFGALVPVLLDRCRVDPAVASGPFITIANDISALLIYFGVTLLMVRHLA
jgi:magnesium transporter